MACLGFKRLDVILAGPILPVKCDPNANLTFTGFWVDVLICSCQIWFEVILFSAAGSNAPPVPARGPSMHQHKLALTTPTVLERWWWWWCHYSLRDVFHFVLYLFNIFSIFVQTLFSTLFHVLQIDAICYGILQLFWFEYVIVLSLSFRLQHFWFCIVCMFTSPPVYHLTLNSLGFVEIYELYLFLLSLNNWTFWHLLFYVDLKWRIILPTQFVIHF